MKPEPLEKTNPDIADFFMDIAGYTGENRIHNVDYGIKGITVNRKSEMVFITRQNQQIVIHNTVENGEKVGRNSPCPICKENGKIIKWKKCKIHNI